KPAPAATAPARSFVDSRVSPRERVCHLPVVDWQLRRCEGAASCQLRQRQQRLRQKGQRPASVHCHHRLEASRRVRKAELKEVVINNQHAGFEFLICLGNRKSISRRTKT
uniref:Ovule protein n=1 Tax=Macrostomum lignano TaxID=282301 RepID=A0A1I8F9A9_9PLAT